MGIERLDDVGEERLEELLALYQAAWWARDRHPDDVRRMLRHTDVKLGFVERETGRLVAFCRVLTDYVYKAFLFDVIVAPEQQGTGLGRALVDAVLEHPDLRGVQMVELYCNEEMVPFYERWGFTQDLGGTRLMRRRNG